MNFTTAIQRFLRWAIALVWIIISHALLAQPLWAASIQSTVEWVDPSYSSALYQRAEQPVPLKFPQDFGAHTEYQTEWWYYTGNLETPEGRDFGYQLTIFRRAIAPEDAEHSSPAKPSSDWRSRQMYLAHFSISDIQSQAFYPHERFSRAGVGLAGAQAEPYKIWLEDWTMMEDDDHQVHLQAQAEPVAINLTLQQTRPPVLQGDRGYSVKGPEPGNASYYYSRVQQPTQGTVQIGDQTYSVSGISWMDHEYSTSGLSPHTEGWDWFSIQFEDQSSLMIYQLRQDNGTSSEFSKGTFIEADGTAIPLKDEDFNISVLDHWKSRISHTTYPSQWKISVPKLELMIEGRPLMNNQELNLSTVYWEGAVTFSGHKQSHPVKAQGYVEMTGYRESLTALR